MPLSVITADSMVALLLSFEVPARIILDRSRRNFTWRRKYFSLL